MDAKEGQKQGLWPAVSLAWELGYTIAIPLVVFALLGRIADQKFGTKPWLLLAGILLSILSSSWAVAVKIKKIMKESAESPRRPDGPPRDDKGGEI